MNELINDEQLLDLCLTLVSIGGIKYLKGPVKNIIMTRAQSKIGDDQKKIKEEIDRMLFLKDIEIMANDNLLDIDNSDGFIKINFTESGLEKINGLYK